MLSHRLRRVLVAAPSSFRRYFSSSRSSNSTPVASLLPRSVVRQPSGFGRSPAKLFSTAQYQFDPYTGEDSFTPDNEGCDFNHWLITMDFPKENPPPRDEMISIFEQTCAKGLGVSLEEAKKKIYAICTTSYQGFQATMTIGEVEKFRDLPGIQYIIPDSYVDVDNKVYGGDKYENGVITPGPVPVPTREGFDSLGKESTLGQVEAQRSQTPSDEGLTSSEVLDQGSQIPSDQRGFKQRQGTLALRQWNSQESRISVSRHGFGRSQGTRMPAPRQGKDLVQGSQMPSFHGGFKQGQGTQTVGKRQAFQQGYNQGVGTQGQNQGSQIPLDRMEYNQGQGAQMPPCRELPSSYGQGAYREPSQENYVQGTQGNYNQMGGGNYIPRRGNYGSAQGARSPGFGNGYSGHGDGRGGMYNQGHETPMSGQGQGGEIPPYQGTPDNCGQWVFVNYNQGPSTGNIPQGPQQNYNQGGQWDFNGQNVGYYGPTQFGYGYSGYTQGRGNSIPQYQLSYNYFQGAPFPGQWRCQGCGMPILYQESYNQGQGTPNYGRWQGFVMPSYQANYSHSQGIYNHGIPSRYSQGTSGNYNEGSPVNYNQMRQGTLNLQSGGNYGPIHGSVRSSGQGQNQTFQQDDQSNNNYPTGQSETGKISHEGIVKLAGGH